MNLIHEDQKMAVYEVQGLTQYAQYSKRLHLRFYPKVQPVVGKKMDSELRVNHRHDGTAEFNIVPGYQCFENGIAGRIIRFLLNNVHGSLEFCSHNREARVDQILRNAGFQNVKGKMVRQNPFDFA